MAVKITIAVEKTANDQDLEIGETPDQNISVTVVVTKGECDFLFLIFFLITTQALNVKKNKRRDLLSNLTYSSFHLSFPFSLQQQPSPTQIAGGVRWQQLGELQAVVRGKKSRLGQISWAWSSQPSLRHRITFHWFQVADKRFDDKKQKHFQLILTYSKRFVHDT